MRSWCCSFEWDLPGSGRHCVRRGSNIREAQIFLKRLFKNVYITEKLIVPTLRVGMQPAALCAAILGRRRAPLC
ncbi:hypothetical protein EMIT0P265_80058 [Pseudomonas zeae]